MNKRGEVPCCWVYWKWRRPLRKDWRGKGFTLERFAEMARFNYGSTVIVLLPRERVELDGALGAEQAVKLGQRLGRVS